MQYLKIHIYIGIETTRRAVFFESAKNSILMIKYVPVDL